MNSSGIEVTWWPYPPTPNSVIYHPAPDSALPKNGKFIPITDVPYLVMTVKDKATGCSKSYKTRRYIISEAAPELWVTPSNTMTCVGGEVCFEVVFDAQLSNYQTSLLPTEIEVRCKLRSPTNNQGPLQNDKLRILTLKLINPSGLYKGSFCENEYFQHQTNLNFENNPYKLEVSMHGSAASIWSNIPTFNQHIEILHTGPGIGDFHRCNPTRASSLDYALHFTFGVTPCPNPPGNICADGGFNAITMAKEFIEILPAADLEIVPSISQPTLGRRFVINPCVEFQLIGDYPESSQAPPSIVVERKDTLSADALGDARLEVYPNPFGDEINIRYIIPADCVGKTTLALFDVTGKKVEVIQQLENCPQGEHQIKYDTSRLPPGLYFYELKTCKNQRIVRRAAKITNH